MADLERILRGLEDLRRGLDELTTEVAAMQQAERLGTARAVAVASPEEAELPVFLPSDQANMAEAIVGGRETRDFPDCCAVGNEQGYFCTGTLIAPNLVVTAAHCRQVRQVFLAGYDVRQPQTGEVIRVAREFTHPTEDLRVLVLESDSKIVAPRHVAQGLEASTKTLKGKNALVVGFGTVNLQGTLGYGLKRMVEVPIHALSCRTQAQADRYGCRRKTELVAGHRGLLKDTCHGDSGGPLYIASPQGDYYLLGATSRGLRSSTVPCGDGGIYVRVDLCLDWIRQQTGVNVEGSRL